MSFPSFGFDGQATTQVFNLVPTNPIKDQPPLDIPESRTRDCCNAFAIKALADLTTLDDFKNDRSGFLWWFNPFVSTATLTLQKYDNTINDFVDLIALNNNTYGIYYAYGFFTNDAGEKFVGYQLKWRNVLSTHGAGGYRVKCTPTTVITSTTDFYSPNYCLKHYSSERADVTVRVEYYLSHITGVSSDDYVVKDLGNLTWYNAFRMPGYFGFPKSTYESDYVEYNNGQRQWVEDEQEVEYTMKLRQIPSFLHEIMRTDVMQADKIFITDYNSKNPQAFIQKQVIKNGEYAPDWKRLQSKLAGVEVSFRQEYNNLKKLNC